MQGDSENLVVVCMPAVLLKIWQLEVSDLIIENQKQIPHLLRGKSQHLNSGEKAERMNREAKHTKRAASPPPFP